MFELSPNGSGGWTETVLHSLTATARTGQYPDAGLIFNNADGNLCGTTQYGGLNGDGTAFELMFNGFGWQDRLLHSFSGTDGAFPQAALNGPHSSSVLYGTTYAGGAHNLGTVFELTPTQGGNWNEMVLHSFSPSGGDGNYPQGSVIGDDSGNLYGMTSAGALITPGRVGDHTLGSETKRLEVGGDVRGVLGGEGSAQRQIVGAAHSNGGKLRDYNVARL